MRRKEGGRRKDYESDKIVTQNSSLALPVIS
jgi:hypothetical protein